ncbi:hypothetical protein [Actinoplanes sp. M2I2]|uniref:hypothetical protein n=1 Tax=Actinoplanes sp. M2I2 TaxID=1734444 RepID=UPI002021AF31|nr:hypothetical protein [Actinoplanes sp. M2I2]
MMGGLELPPLDEDCPRCTGADAREERARDIQAWHEEEQRAFQDWVAERRARGNPNAGDRDAWRRVAQGRAWFARKPEEIGDVGCVECDYTGRRPTAAGRTILEFLAVHRPKG